MIDVRKMLAWNDEMHARWFEGLERLPEDVLNAKVDASFLTPLGILTHMANVESAWMDVVEGNPNPKWGRVSTKEHTTLAPVRAYAEEVRARTHRLVDGLTEAELQRSCPVGWKTGAPAFTVEQILFTIVTHEHFHRGEIQAVLWQRDIEPPALDYPAYAAPLA